MLVRREATGTPVHCGWERMVSAVENCQHPLQLNLRCPNT